MKSKSTSYYKLDVLLIIVLPTILRLFLISCCELCEDEAYYWQWARHLDLSFHDQGPGVALAIKIGTWLLGHTETGVRLVSVILFAAACLFTYHLALRLYNRRAAVAAMIIFNLCPLFGLGSLLMMHESVQGFFWAAAMYFLWWTTEEDQPTQNFSKSWSGWLLVGACLGLGFLGKYTMLLFVPGTFFFLVLNDQRRRWLKRPEPYAALLLSLVIVSPVIYWNFTHNFNSVLQVVSLGNHSGKWPINPLNTFELAGAAAGLVTPIFFGLMVWRLYHAWQTGVRGNDKVSAFLFWLAVCYFGPFYLLSLRSYVYGNWPGLGYFPALLLVAGWVGHLSPKENANSLKWWRAGYLLAGALSAIVLIQLAFSPLPLPPKIDGANRMRGAKQLGEQVSETVREIERAGTPVLLYAKNYQVASLLAFYADGQPTTYEIKGEARPNQYDYWPDLPRGSNALLVLKEKERVPQITQDSFASIKQLKDLEIKRKGQIIKIFRLLLCRDYQPATD